MSEGSPDELLATHGVPETSFCRVHIPQSLADSVGGACPPMAAGGEAWPNCCYGAGSGRCADPRRAEVGNKTDSDTGTSL